MIAWFSGKSLRKELGIWLGSRGNASEEQVYSMHGRRSLDGELGDTAGGPWSTHDTQDNRSYHLSCWCNQVMLRGQLDQQSLHQKRENTVNTNIGNRGWWQIAATEGVTSETARQDGWEKEAHLSRFNQSSSDNATDTQRPLGLDTPHSFSNIKMTSL